MFCSRSTPIALTHGVIVATTGAVVIPSPASGLSPKRLERVTAVLDTYIKAGELAGAVSLVYRRGEVAHVSARGVQDLETRTPMARDTISDWRR